MFRRPPKFVATPEDPFKNDKLGREDSIRNLTMLMEGTDTPMVMTVSAPWGSGKSSFVQMWKAYLESEEGGKHPCIMFDAWKHDFHKEPLLAAMGEIGAFIKTHEAAYPEAQSYFEKCLKHAPKLLKAVGGVASLLSFVHPAVGIVGKGAKTAEKAIENVNSYVFEEYSLQKESVEDFKQELANFIQLITNGGETGPLYFFVDELDRCDPEYAIRLLESVKHFFDVEGIVFVLSVDRKKLGSMVRVRYGDGFDADGYLKRFVDIDYEISEPERENWIRYLCEDVLQLLGEPVAKDRKQLEEFLETAIELADDFQLTARDIEKVFLKLAPLLLNDFSLLSENVFKRAHEYDGTPCIDWIAPKFSMSLTPYVTDKYILNFYYPLLILAFLKETSRMHYERFDEAYSRNTPEELAKGLPQSRYTEIFNALKNTTASVNVGDVAIGELNKYTKNRMGSLCRVGIMLGANPTYWTQKEKLIRSQLDSLDNITFLSAEDSSEDTNAA